MRNDFDEILGHVKTPSSWLRVLFMLGFCVILYVTGVVILVLTLVQALFSLLTGNANDNLRRLGAALSDYVTEILQFLCYNSEVRPFPFTPFPEIHGATFTASNSDDENDAEVNVGREAQVKTKTRKPATNEDTVAESEAKSAKKSGKGKTKNSGDAAENSLENNQEI